MISVDGGGKVKVEKIDDFTGPIIVSFEGIHYQEQSFKFSIDSVVDADSGGTSESSGHYSMAINKTDAETNSSLYIKEV